MKVFRTARRALHRAGAVALRFARWRWAFSRWYVRRRSAPYFRHLFSRYKLRGAIATWCLKKRGWFRVGRVILRWEVQ